MPTSRILDGIHRFQDYYLENADLLQQLAEQGQSPEALFIGCSDSRVPLEVITGAGPGDLFILRNVANIVPPYGTGHMSVGAVLEYALLELPLQHIVICGHTRCGGIEALDRDPDWVRASHIARWIEHARPAKTKIEAAGLEASARHLATVRENVLLQLEHLRSYDLVRERERAGDLALHGWVYHLETGQVEAYNPGTGAWEAVGTESED
jgi:carbonic anhydrase